MATPRTGGDIDVDDELQLLLKEQEDFMRQRARPAATVKRMGPGSNSPVPESPSTPDPIPDDGPQVVGLVKERDSSVLDNAGRLQVPRMTSGGFPAVKRRGESVFGRRQRQQNAETPVKGALSGMGRIVEHPPTVTASKPARSDVVSEAEWKEIDDSNTQTLQNMSTADIRAAQEELYRMLDPELLAKLKYRHQSKTIINKVETKSTFPKMEKKPDDVVVATQRLKAAGVDLSHIETEEQLFAEAARLSPEERAKHEWMQPVQSDKTKSESKRRTVRPEASKRGDIQASTERFDFNGDVVSSVVAPPSHSGLYHHGDEPEAAGYTMEELLTLARSTVASQRAVALLTISKILRKRDQQVQHQPDRVVPQILPPELLVALRMTLDDQNYTALSASITALHAFLCPSDADDDTMFDTTWGMVVPAPQIHLHINVGTTPDELLREVIYIDTNESDEDGSTIGDQELTSLDPVQGLLKMTIVPRLSYIVTTIQLPDEDALDKLINILIHIAAHSPRAAQAVAADRKLMKALQTKYLENEHVLTLQTEPVDEFAKAAARSSRVLRLVRVLCQGSRAVATIFVESSIIQTTKGFLGVRDDRITGSTQHPLELIQLESLRIWRVLLSYGLDFHCFSYLYPLLCGFDGANLVHDKSDTATGVKRWSNRCLAAIFAALEAFARLDTIHEAQHYFNQFGYFIQLASQEIVKRLPKVLEQDVVSNAALRFLSACTLLVDKFHFDRTPFNETFKSLQKHLTDASWKEHVLQSPGAASTIVAMATFGMHVLNSDLVGDDQDEDELRKQFFLAWKPLVSSLIQKTAPSNALYICELLLIATAAFLRVDHHDDQFIRSLYGAALQVVQDLKPGHQFWIHSLFGQVLFHPIVLQKTGFFPDLQDATTMAHVLIPIYQALVNSTKGQEEHSQLLFAFRSNPKQKQTCHLVDPQDEHGYVGSNLPLPFFWMFSPFSRLEYASQPKDNKEKQKHAATTLGPSHAEAEEMKVIVSAACRYIDQLESIVGAVRSSTSDSTELGDEDKLFHLMHLFFAGTDVLFDEYVDLALAKLLNKYVHSILHNPNPTTLYDGLLRNLREFESIEAGEKRASSKDEPSNTPTSFTTETQTVMTFVERLVNEFTSSSFGNTHFARIVTLFMLHDFPLETRMWVWKELASSHLLHRLEPFSGTDARHATGLRATRDAKHSNELLIRAMTQAIATRQHGIISHERGPFAYWLAIHHTIAYVFGDDKSTEFSAARQKLLRDLVVDASPTVWRHLLSHDITTFSPSSTADIKHTRVNRVLQYAGFTEVQDVAFHQALE